MVLGLAGCTNAYRPVVSAINPVGPAAQPTKYAIAISSPSATGSGLLTIVDFAGDTVLATPPIVPNQTYFAVNSDASQGIAINNQSGLSAIPLSTPNALIASRVVQATLPTNVTTPTVNSFTFGGQNRIFVPEIGQANTQASGTSSVAVFGSTNGATTGTVGTVALQQQISVGANPVYVVGVAGTPRAYAISTGAGTGPGEVDAIESANFAVSNRIAVGVNPTYGVETADNRRVFVTNAGSGTVSVINVTNNALDNAHPVIPAIGTLGLNPVWADLVAATNTLVVLNQGDGTTPGSLSIINIPLCNALAQANNPSCDPNNPSDGATFGTLVGTVPVGINPVMVSVLADGSRAYVVNQGILPGVSSAVPNGVEGAVSVVNLVSATVSATVPAATASSPILTPTCPNVSTSGAQGCVYGHPTTIAVTNASPTGKVYITSPDSNFLTVIETDTDTVDTHVNLQGTGVRVRVSAP